MQQSRQLEDLYIPMLGTLIQPVVPPFYVIVSAHGRPVRRPFVSWPVLCWCAAKQLLTHSLTHSLRLVAITGCWSSRPKPFLIKATDIISPLRAKFIITWTFCQLWRSLRNDSVASYRSIWTQFWPSGRGPDVPYNALNISSFRQ